jgi:hypothetical protein
MAHLAIFRPVGKRISCKHFYESMKLILVAFVLLMLMGPVNGQQTAVDLYNKGVVLDDKGQYDAAIKAYDEALKLVPFQSDFSWK